MRTRREVLGGTAASALLPLVAGYSIPGWSGESAAAAPTLGAIRAVTLTAADLAAVEAAWTKFMGYRVVRRGRVPRVTAESWGAPALRGKRYVILGPDSGEPTYLRYVEQATPADYDASHTYGWNATEITVQNNDELYERLKGSPFKVARPPSVIPTYPYLKAMPATGPAGERVLLTWIMEKRPDLAVAQSFVGKCFITVQASPDLPGSIEYFRTMFGNVSSPIRQLPTLQLSVVTLKEGAKIEIDQHGAGGRPRPRVPGGLPAGLALVTFDCSSFDNMADRFLARPHENALDPHRGRRTGTMAGMAGELIELLDA